MKHPPLATLQAQFISDLLTGKQESASFIREGKISPAGHLSIYQDSVQAILTDILKDFYDVTSKLVGEPFFNAMALQFIKKHPPASGNMDVYGDDFPGFIEKFPPAQTLPYLADVARLEWVRHQAFVAPKAPRLTGKGLAQLAKKGESQKLALHPSVGMVLSVFPILRIWEVNQEENLSKNRVINLQEEGGQSVLAYRQAGTLHLQLLSPWQAELLKALEQGVPLDGAVEAALLLEEAEKIQDFLVECIHRGLFTENTLTEQEGHPDEE